MRVGAGRRGRGKPPIFDATGRQGKAARPAAALAGRIAYTPGATAGARFERPPCGAAAAAGSCSRHAARTRKAASQHHDSYHEDSRVAAAQDTHLHLSSGEITRRELYFTNLFRVLQASTYIGLSFSPWLNDLMRPQLPLLARATALLYLPIALALLFGTRRALPHLRTRMPPMIAIDVLAAMLMIIAIPDARTGIAGLLIVNLSAGAALLTLRAAFSLAGGASLALMLLSVFEVVFQDRPLRLLLEGLLFTFAYIAAAWLNHTLGRQMRASEALAERRGLDLANLAQVNELIIKRMKTGVMLVDAGNHIHQINESAWLLLGNPASEQRDLGSVAPELSRRLYHWRNLGRVDETAVALAEGVPEVIPRFTRLAANDDSHVLIFLDDTSLVSRRAEEMTLSSLGRLSASIAHEIRNPLAAIRYSAQLLAESPDLSAEDARMVEIINNHCVRLNDIVENILQLSRRDRSRPEVLDLNDWVLRFVEEYSESNDLGEDSLRAVTQARAVEALADPQHLQQVVWNLVQNALRYGRLPSEPARVMVIARNATEIGPPLLEVVDRGPGIPPKVAAQIFEPFFTTHEMGTGLGLYLARQMCEANQATLEYVPVPGGGSCFRITLGASVRMANTV
ncbi:MAG: two-component sensor histidine kinase [Metallibacterium scheffleri]|nr:two-component sensor histidine kinase [Metallibacterium scheffleri]